MLTRVLSQRLVLLVIGLAAGSGILIPASYGSFHPVTSSEIQDGTIQSVDIGTGQVKASDIGGGAVTSAKIADGAVTYGDVSRALVAVEHRDDCNCGGTGWDPDGTQTTELIVDNRISKNSAVSVTMTGIAVLTCGTYGARDASFELPASVVVKCTTNIPAGTGVNYAIFNNPAYN